MGLETNIILRCLRTIDSTDNKPRPVDFASWSDAGVASRRQSEDHQPCWPRGATKLQTGSQRSLSLPFETFSPFLAEQ